jgi:hypothetical protein
MKRLLALACAVLALGSCSTLSNSGPPFTVTVTSPSQDDLVQVTASGLETVNRLSTGLQVVGVDIQVQNKADKSLTIRWGDSSIDYNGKSHVVFLNGHYLSDAGRQMPDNHLSPGETITIGVIPADGVPAPSSAAYAPNQAPYEPIYSKDITCRISIDLGGEARLYVVNVLVGEKQ